MANRSQSITGLLILAAGFLFQYAGAPLTDGELEAWLVTSAKFLQVGGFVWAYLGRLRKGDVKLFGAYKVL